MKLCALHTVRYICTTQGVSGTGREACTALLPLQVEPWPLAEIRSAPSGAGVWEVGSKGGIPGWTAERGRNGKNQLGREMELVDTLSAKSDLLLLGSEAQDSRNPLSRLGLYSGYGDKCPPTSRRSPAC